jgi:histone deacetylase HOS3
MPETPRHTAESIASNHFKIELDLHDKEDTLGETRRADTIVILHEACYGHRFSRPGTTRFNFSTIVERPERLNASILGLSAAYVRLGERHSQGQYPLHPDKDPSDIPTTPFRIRKTTRRLPLTSQAVTNVHGVKWMEELKIMCDAAEHNLATGTKGKEVARPDIARDPKTPATPFHDGDLYLCEESLNAMEGALGAVCEGVDAVFQGSGNGKGPHRTFVAIRPPGHHCSASYPSGFCWLNNVHVGISHAALTHGLTHAAIIDFDLHHGDGSQAIAYDQNTRALKQPKNALSWKKTSIGYFSLHDINSYPCESGGEEKVNAASICIENAHGQSIWNVHLQPWKSEAEFWELYEKRYSVLIEKTRSYLRFQTERLRSIVSGPKPKGAIFLSAGFDASEWESDGMQRHKVNVPTEFYARLTRDVVKLAAEEGCAVDGRIISVLEGGYSNRALCTGVFSHLSGLAGGDPIAIKKEFEHNGLGYEMGQKVSAFDGVGNTEVKPGFNGLSYDPSWWSLPHLEHLEDTVSPHAAPEPKKPREGTPPTYSSPTTSFIAKVTSPEARRKVSNMGRSNGSPRPITRAPTPPPPEVDWAVAAHELSKLLIPSLTRQTESYKFEELAAEATRIKKDRQSILTPPASVCGSDPTEVVAPRMGLRARKPPKALIDMADEDEVKKPRAGRRKTVAGSAALAEDKVNLCISFFEAILGLFSYMYFVYDLHNILIYDTQAIVRSTTPKPEPNYTQPTKQSNRRLSTASTTSSIISDAPSGRPNGHGRVPSIGTTAFSRPGTSASVRPDSSMSSRGPSVPQVVLTVKKARAPSQPRTEASKTARVRRKSPLNETAETAQDMEPASRNGNLVLPSIEPNTGSTDMDNLATTMGVMTMNNAALVTSAPEVKQPKLKLTTQAQRDARAQAAQAAASNASGQDSISSLGLKKIRDSTPILPRKKVPTPAAPFHQPKQENIPPPKSTTSLPIYPGQLKQEVAPPLMPIDVPKEEESIPPLKSTVDLQVHTSPVPLQHKPDLLKEEQYSKLEPKTDAELTFIPYEPEGPPAVPITHHPLRFLPPNTGTPTNLKELPVFSPTGPIPFGTVKARAETKTELGEQIKVDKAIEGQKFTAESADDSIWDVPETPERRH